MKLIMFVFCFCVCAPISFLCYLSLQMYRRSFRGKEPVMDLTSSPVSKRTWHSSEVSNNERFKTPLDSQTFSSTFQEPPTGWSGLSSLTPWDPPLSLGFLKTKIRQIYSKTLRI